MKKLTLVIAFAGILAASCTKSSLPEGVLDNVYNPMIEVGIPQEMTKVALGGESAGNMDLVWSSGDQIAVIDGANKSIYRLVSGVGTKNGVFKYVSGNANPQVIKKVVYPSSASENVPTAQTYNTGTFDSSAAVLSYDNPEATNSSQIELQAKNSFVCFQLKGSDKLTSIRLAVDGGSTYTLSIPSVQLSSTPTPFHIVVPATASGRIDVTFISSAGEMTRILPSKAFEAGKMHRFASIAFKADRTLRILTYNVGQCDKTNSSSPQFIANIAKELKADVAVMNYAASIGQEVHLSTQLNISNIEALKFYARFADVVVLARELCMGQVAEIYRHIKEEHICGPSGQEIRIEMFCHGALCMAVSGKCYLSLHNMNSSANRGACMQVCRRSYTVRDKETDVELDIDNQYIMSPKDLKTIHFMNKMMDAGVRVFKIEGRARGPEYVRTVVECYKEAIEAYLADDFSDDKLARWNERLATVFNRGFWDGYYMGQRLGEWTKNYGSAATERKIYVGKGIRYYSNIGVSEFLVEAAEVSVGDKLLITGPTTGAEFLTLEEARVDLKPVKTVHKGEHFYMKSVKIRTSDKLYKLVSVEELKHFKGLDIEKVRG